nr:A52R-like family protein [Wadden Sea poxvirus]
MMNCIHQSDDKDDYDYDYDYDNVFFIYDTIDKIDIYDEDNVKYVIEEYFSWRYYIGTLGFLPVGIGKVYTRLMFLDTKSNEYFGNLSTVVDNFKLNSIDNANENLKSLLKHIDFESIDCFIVIGLFGFVSEKWGKYKLIRYLPEMMENFVTCVNYIPVNKIYDYCNA